MSGTRQQPFIYNGRLIEYDTFCGVPSTTPLYLGPHFYYGPNSGCLLLGSAGVLLDEASSSTVVAGVEAGTTLPALSNSLISSNLIALRRLVVGGIHPRSSFRLPGFFPAASPSTLNPVVTVEGDVAVEGAVGVSGPIYARDVIATGPKSAIDGSYPGGRVYASLVDTTTLVARELIWKEAQLPVKKGPVVLRPPYPRTLLVIPREEICITLAGFPAAGTQLVIKDYTAGAAPPRCPVPPPRHCQIVIRAGDGNWLEGPTGRYSCEERWILSQVGEALTLEYASPICPGGAAGWIVISHYQPHGSSHHPSAYPASSLPAYLPTPTYSIPSTPTDPATSNFSTG